MAAGFAFAETASEPNAAATRLREQFENTRKKLTENEEQQRTIMSSLFDINRKMKKLVSEKSKTDQERMVLESTAKSLAQKILDLETKLKEQRTLLQIRLNAIYKLGGQGLARLILSSSNSAQLERNLKILGLVAKNDLALMKDYSGSVAELEFKRAKFVNRLASLKRARRKAEAQEMKITRESLDKAKILENIRQSKMKTIVRLKGLREKGQKMGLNGQDDELLDLLLRPSFFEKRGALVVPVEGNLVRKFGLWKDDQFDVTLNHRGLFYQTKANTQVVAVFPGKVAYQGPVEGFGQTLILDHGDHYYSVYSGLSNVTAILGTEVGEGQKIAQVEQGLYFEIRHFSEPSDPLPWMKGRE